MERISNKSPCLDCCSDRQIGNPDVWQSDCYRCQKLPNWKAKVINRLATIEDILGDNYDLDCLKEIVQADREGRLFETPFKIGTHIFEINDGNIGEWEVIGFSFGVPYLRVFGSHNHKNEVFVIAKGITVDGRMRFQFTLSEIGEKVFLSQKEAESELERMKEGDK